MLGNPRFHFHLTTLSQREKLTLEYKKGGKKEFFKDLWNHEKTIEKEMSGICDRKTIYKIKDEYTVPAVLVDAVKEKKFVSRGDINEMTDMVSF